MGKNADILEVAKKAGVSKSTVSRVLNGSYGTSAQAREKVLKAAEELKYKPNISARYLRTSKNNLIGILISDELAETGIVHPVNSRKISGIVNRAKELGFDVLVFIEDISDRSRLNNIIKEKGLCGILLLDPVSAETLESFWNSGIPFVQVNWFIPGLGHQCYVKTDLARGVDLAMDVLTSKGYKDIALINWEDKYQGEKTIENAFNRCLRSKGLEGRGLVWNTDIHIEKDALYRFIEDSGKRAFLCFSYYASADMLEYCWRRNIRVPQELAVLSYEFFPFFDYIVPRLSGIRQRAELMGQAAVDSLAGLIRGAQDVQSLLIEPEIVLRDSI